MGKLLPLESLRGLAALTVVIFHFGVGSHFNNPFTLNGFLLVGAIGLGTLLAGYLYPNTSEELTNAVEEFEKK